MLSERPLAPVLVVDDNIEVRQAFASLLEGEGYRVAEADDGVAALRLLREGQIYPRPIPPHPMMPRLTRRGLPPEQSPDPRPPPIPLPGGPPPPPPPQGPPPGPAPPA